MALMLLLGTSSAWAQNYNYHWKGKVYFLVPEQWNLDQYSNIQVDITRTTDPAQSNYQTYTNISQTTRIGTSRLYYINLDINHSDWKQNEYITFTANDHAYGSGTFNLNGNHYYAIPIDYDCNNESNYYLFIPTDVSQFTTTENGNTIKGSWSDNRNILKAAQTVNIYTDGAASNSGGSVNLTGYYFNNSDTAIEQSTATSTSATETYNGAVIGSEMTLTASANTGYEFDGWYNEASGGTLLSSSATYTYNVYEAKTIYARFTQSCNTATLSWSNTFNGSMKVGDEVTNPASLDNAAAASSISYTSSNPDVISVNGTTLTALKSGTATITASATPKDGFCIESIEKDVTVTCDVVNTEDIKIEVVCTSGDTPYIWAWEPENNNKKLTGNDWPGQVMTSEGNNVYSWEAKPTSGESVSIIISKQGANQTNDIDGLQIGKRYKFSYDPNTTVSGSNNRYVYQLLEEDCLAPACTTPNFYVQLSNATVTKGDANIKASVAGTHSPAVTWSSSETSVATIDADGNITAIKEGQTNITATTTGDDGFCGGVEKTATLTVKSPITNVTLAHANSDGTEKTETPTYCVGDVVYFKLTHNGSPFSEYDWTTYPGSGLAGYCSNGSGLYHFTLSGAGTIGISLRNDANLDGETKTWAVSNNLEFTTYPDPVAPTISLDNSTLCDNDLDGATITVSGAVVNQFYALYKEATDDGDDTQVGEPIRCTSEEQSISFNLTGAEVAGKYYVLAIEPNCNRTAGTSSVTLSVISTEGLSISIEPDAATVTPWETAKLTVSATEGYTYTLTGLENMEYTANGNVYNVKIPKPETTDLDDDGNITFNAVEYTVTATLDTGGEVSCVSPATCTLTLTPYIEPCTQE